MKFDLNKEEIYVVMVEDLFPDLGLLSKKSATYISHVALVFYEHHIPQ